MSQATHEQPKGYKSYPLTLPESDALFLKFGSIQRDIEFCWGNRRFLVKRCDDKSYRNIWSTFYESPYNFSVEVVELGSNNSALSSSPMNIMTEKESLCIIHLATANSDKIFIPTISYRQDLEEGEMDFAHELLLRAMEIAKLSEG